MKPKIERACTIPLSIDKAERLLKFAKDGREKRVIFLMLQTGIHPACLSNPDYGLHIIRDDLLTWTRVRNGKRCNWLIPKEFMREIRILLEEDVGLHSGSYWRLVARVAKRAGIEDCSPLTLRHTATILRLKEGRSEEEIIGILRCSEKVLWKHYGRIKATEPQRRA